MTKTIYPIPINLSNIPTTPPEGLTKAEGKKQTREIAREIADLHEMMMAGKNHNILVVFQGMDSSGKDGATSNVFRYCSPIGISAYSFKKPTEEEFAHDFLWRVHKQAPQKGTIKIFNRSHYEDILIQRVHGWIDEERVNNRIKSINAFEELLQYDNNTTILKFYMHLSRARQKEKLQERLDMLRKNWKHNGNDWKEAEHWDKYRKCYEDAINRSSIPWHIVPVDSRWYRDLVIAQTVLDTMRGFKLEWPPLPDED